MKIYPIPNEDTLLSAIRQSNGTLFIKAGDNRYRELAPDSGKTSWPVMGVLSCTFPIWEI